MNLQVLGVSDGLVPPGNRSFPAGCMLPFWAVFLSRQDGSGLPTPELTTLSRQAGPQDEAVSTLCFRKGGTLSSGQSSPSKLGLSPEPEHGPRLHFRNTSDSLAPSFPGSNRGKTFPKGAHLAS